MKLTDLTDLKSSKNRVLFTIEELLDEAERMTSSRISRDLTWRRKTPTVAAEKMRSATGMRMASKRSQQLRALSPASTRASGGARV